jgi:hypothetical protein
VRFGVERGSRTCAAKAGCLRPTSTQLLERSELLGVTASGNSVSALGATAAAVPQRHLGLALRDKELQVPAGAHTRNPDRSGTLLGRLLVAPLPQRSQDQLRGLWAHPLPQRLCKHRLGPTENPIYLGLVTDQRPQPTLMLGSVLRQPASEVIQRERLQQVVGYAELESAFDSLRLCSRLPTHAAWLRDHRAAQDHVAWRAKHGEVDTRVGIEDHQIGWHPFAEPGRVAEPRASAPGTGPQRIFS